MLEEIIEFSKLVGKLKKVERTGWVTIAKIDNPESVAEHSFRTAVIAMMLADLRKLDVEKTVRMALLHDLVEAITGDWDLFAKKKLTNEVREEREKEGVEKVLGLLPKSLRPKYEKIFEEYKNKSSEEAKLVKEIDRFELLLQAAEYEKEGYDKKRLERFWKDVEPQIEDEEIKSLTKLLKG